MIVINWADGTIPNRLLSIAQAVSRRSILVYVLFGALFFLSNALSYLSHGSFGVAGSIIIAASAAVLYVVVLVVLGLLVPRLPALSSSASRSFCGKKLFIICFALFEFEFVVVLLANYPGFCTADSNDIINQALGQFSWSTWYRYDGLSNHHPVFYTLCVWIVFKITAFAGNLEFSTFAFCLIQSTMVALALSWSLVWLDRKVVSKPLTVGALLFFLLTPVVSAFAPVVWKDVPFGVLILLLSLCLFDLAMQESKPTKAMVAKLFFLLLAITLVRNNGLYVVLIVLAALFVMMKWAKKTAAILISLILAINLVIQGPLFSALSIEKSHFSESVAIPLQQIAYVIKSDGEVSDEQKEFLDSILPIEEWGELYRKTTPNKVKHSLDFNDAFLEAHKMEFLSVWAQMLPCNFAKYVRAWALETEGYWHFGYYGEIGATTSLYDSEPRSLIGFQVSPSEIAEGQSRVLSPILCMGSIVWIVVTAFALALSSGGNDRRRLLCFIPALSILLTLYIAAPIASDFRYVFPLFLLIPFLPVFLAPQEERNLLGEG